MAYYLPLRWLNRLVCKVFIRFPIQIIKWVLGLFIPVLLRKEKLASRINKSIIKWPWLHNHLVNLAKERRKPKLMTETITQAAEPSAPDESTLQDSELSAQDAKALPELTPRALKIFNDLKMAIEKQHKELD